MKNRNNNGHVQALHQTNANDTRLGAWEKSDHMTKYAKLPLVL